mgnify:CR=1 FL=1
MRGVLVVEAGIVAAEGDGEGDVDEEADDGDDDGIETVRARSDETSDADDEADGGEVGPKRVTMSMRLSDTDE